LVSASVDGLMCVFNAMGDINDDEGMESVSVILSHFDQQFLHPGVIYKHYFDRLNLTFWSLVKHSCYNNLTTESFVLMFSGYECWSLRCKDRVLRSKP